MKFRIQKDINEAYLNNEQIQDESLNENQNFPYHVWFYLNTSGRSRGFEPDVAEDFGEVDESDLLHVFEGLGLDVEDLETEQDFIDYLEQADLTDGSPIIYRIDKNGKTIYEHGFDYFEDLKKDVLEQENDFDESLKEEMWDSARVRDLAEYS